MGRIIFNFLTMFLKSILSVPQSLPETLRGTKQPRLGCVTEPSHSLLLKSSVLLDSVMTPNQLFLVDFGARAAISHFTARPKGQRSFLLPSNIMILQQIQLPMLLSNTLPIKVCTFKLPGLLSHHQVAFSLPHLDVCSVRICERPRAEGADLIRRN